jgi:N-acetylglutamate synthase/N-acetylornithine aminotransferase
LALPPIVTVLPSIFSDTAICTTDASIESNTLHQLLKSSTDHTFNMITVDGDTSTNQQMFPIVDGFDLMFGDQLADLP